MKSMTFFSDRLISRILLSLGILSTLFVVFLTFWCCSRGFTLTDEGYYALSARYPSDIHFLVSGFFYLSNFIFKLLGYHLLYLRYVTVSINLFLVFILSLSFIRLIKSLGVKFDNFYGSVWLLCLLVISSSYLFFIPITLNYNSINNFVLYVSCSCLFFILAKNKLKSHVIYYFVILFTDGFILSLGLFTKFTSAGLMLCINILLIWVWPTINLNFRITYIVTLLIGLIVGLLIIFGFVINIHDWYLYFTNGLKALIVMNSGHDPHTLVLNFMQFAQMSLNGFYDAGKFLLPFCILNFAVRNKSKNYSDLFIILICLLLLCFTTFSHQYDHNRFIDISSMVLSWSVIVLFISKYNLFNNKKLACMYDVLQVKSYLLLGCFLFVLPVIASAGTNNVIYFQVLLSILFWVMLAFFIIASMQNRYFVSGSILSFVMLIFVLLLTYNLTFELVYLPFRINTNMFEQNNPIKNIPALQGIKLDDKSEEIILDVNILAEKCGFHTGDSMIALYDLPGLVYAVGGRSHICPWYVGERYKGFNKFTKMCLENMNDDILSRSYIMLAVNKDFVTPEIVKPYKYCGEVSTVGCVNCGFKADKIMIYKPK